MVWFYQGSKYTLTIQLATITAAARSQNIMNQSMLLHCYSVCLVGRTPPVEQSRMGDTSINSIITWIDIDWLWAQQLFWRESFWSMVISLLNLIAAMIKAMLITWFMRLFLSIHYPDWRLTSTIILVEITGPVPAKISPLPGLYTWRLIHK